MLRPVTSNSQSTYVLEFSHYICTHSASANAYFYVS